MKTKTHYSLLYEYDRIEIAQSLKPRDRTYGLEGGGLTTPFRGIVAKPFGE